MWRLKVGYRKMGRSRSMFQLLNCLGALRSRLLGRGFLRVATLAACLVAMGHSAYLQGCGDGEGSEPRPDTGQHADKAEYPKRDWGKYLNPSCGEILVPRGKLQAWERSPSGFFLTKGERVAQLEKGLELKVLETRRLASLLSGDRFYIRVEPADPKNTSVEAAECLRAGVQCWVYQGQEGADLPENLIPPNLRPTDTDSPEPP